MARYYDMNHLKEMIEAKADTVINGAETFHYIAKWLDLLPPADVVPRAEAEATLKQYKDTIKSEVDRLEYKLAGVMWSVDKWLEGDELNQDEVNRAITMREKTLRIAEELQAEVELERANSQSWENLYNHDVKELSDNLSMVIEKLESAESEVAREIFKEVQSCLIKRHWNELDIVSFEFDAVKFAEIKKKYTEGGEG